MNETMSSDPCEKPDTLVEWAEKNKPADNMIWKDAWWYQVNFISQIWHGILDRQGECNVIGTHRSKSIVCPIVEFRLSDQVWTISNNFHYWHFLRIAATEHLASLNGLLHEGHEEYVMAERPFPEFVTKERPLGYRWGGAHPVSHRIYTVCWMLYNLDPEIKRLKSGQFTPVELNNLCHNLHHGKIPCNREQFNQGCIAFQDMLYGPSQEGAMLLGQLLKKHCVPRDS